MVYQISVGLYTVHIVHYIVSDCSPLFCVIIGANTIFIVSYYKAFVMVKWFLKMYVWELKEGLVMWRIWGNIHSIYN